MAEKTRYSDEELEEFRQIINEKWPWPSATTTR